VIISNPYGSVTSGIVTLTVTLPALQPAITNGNLNLQFSGNAGQTYILQSAASLTAPINWQPIFTNAADANGHWSFTNSIPSAVPAVFFRLTTP